MSLKVNARPCRFKETADEKIKEAIARGEFLFLVIGRKRHEK
jgi:hypothetical protein